MKINQHGTFWLPPSQIHKAHEHHAPSNPHPWNRTVARCGKHVLHVNWRMEFWDVIPVHGATYLGKAKSRDDAISRWKNFLLSIGERAENTEVIDG